MKKNIWYMILLSILTLFPLQTKAICYNNDKIKFSSFANNINSTYVFDENTKTFKIILNNIPEGFIIRDNNQVLHSYSSEKLEFYGYQPGKNYNFDVLTINSDCVGEVLKTIYVTLPTYNPNYSDPLCKGNEEYKICKKWGIYISSRSEFEKEIKKLKEEQITEEKNETLEEHYYGIFDNLANIFVNSYYIVLPIIIVACLIAIYKLNKKEQIF